MHQSPSLNAYTADSVSGTGHVESGLNLDKLDSALAALDPEELRRRRVRLNRMYQEAILSDKGKGISFTAMLFVLAYHKMCSRPTNMEVSEFIDRRALLDKLDSTISLERVRGLLRTVYLRRRFLAARANQEHITRVAMRGDERGFPSITVEGDVGRTPERPRISIDPTFGRLDVNAPRATDALRTPTSGYSDYFGGDIADGASDVHLSPMSASPVARRRLSFQDPSRNPFADQDHGRSADDRPPGNSSSVQPHRTPSPSRDLGAWNSVMRRLSPERPDSVWPNDHSA